MNQEQKQQALERYQPTDASIAEMHERCAGLQVAGLDDSVGLKAVHDARMEVRNIRVNVEKTRKELKKDALEWGRQVDGEAKRITGLLLNIEQPLIDKESIVQREKDRLALIAAEERKAALQVRLNAMAALGGVANSLEVQEWTEKEYEDALFVLALAQKHRVEEEELRKADEVLDARKLAEEREKLRVEREAMQAEQKAADEKAAAERAKLQAEQVELESRKQQLRYQEEKTQRDIEIKEAKEQAVLDAKIREGEQQAAREAEEAELERLRPQSEKVYAYADSVDLLKVPDVDCQFKLRSIMSVASMDVRMLVPSPGRKAEEEVPE